MRTKVIPLLIIGTLLAACSNKKEEPKWSGWTIGPIINGKNYSSVDNPYINNSFNFPICENSGSVKYITKPYTNALNKEIELVFNIEGNVDKIIPVTDGKPARISLYFQRQGDDWQAKNGTEYYRWWSIQPVVLQAGVNKITLPLKLENWTSVINRDKATEQDFKDAIENPLNIGFSFGGVGSAGHGVCLESGEAVFTIIDYKTN